MKRDHLAPAAWQASIANAATVQEVFFFQPKCRKYTVTHVPGAPLYPPRAAGSLWPCPGLEHLSVDCCNATAAIHAVSPQLRRRTGLTALLLHALAADSDPPAWAAFFGALSPLHRLQRLRLRPYHAASQGLTARLTEALRSFRKLTELSLQGGGAADGGEMPVLRCDIFARGLRAVTALRTLGLHDVGLVVPGELWRALRGLTLLQELRVSFCQVRGYRRPLRGWPQVPPETAVSSATPDPGTAPVHLCAP